LKLTNQEIWLACPNLIKIAGGKLGKTVYPGIKLPVKVSLGIATIISKLQKPYLVIENERIKLVQKHGTLDKEAGLIKVGEGNADYSLEFGELLVSEWPDDFQFERIKLPDTITATCGKCGEKMNVSFLIEPNILMPLLEHFLEVV